MNFCEFIQLVVECEAKLEEIRMHLAGQEMFEPFTAFKRLDQPRTSGLKESQILEFLDDNNIKVTEDELAYIFRVLDVDADGTITYEDFKNSVLPKQNDSAKDQALNHKTYEMPIGMLLPKDVESKLAQFFQSLQQNLNQYLGIQEQINLNELDIYENDAQITVQSLKNWLQSTGQDISEDVLQNFIIIIEGSQINLQNLIDQIYLPLQENEEQQQNLQKEENDRNDQNNQGENQIEVQDMNYQQDIQQSNEMQESFNPSQTQQFQQQAQSQDQQQQQQQGEQQIEQQVVQSSIIQQQQETPLLNYYNQQIQEEEAKIKRLCQELQIQNVDAYLSKRNESSLIQYYEKEIQREQENIKKLTNEVPLGSSFSRLKSSFTPYPRYLDRYEAEKIILENEIRKEQAKLLDYQIGLSSSPLKRSFMTYDDTIQQSYIYSDQSGFQGKKPFSPKK